MTAYINKLKDKTGNQQLPVTHERAVRDDNGTTAETKFQNLEGAMDKAYVASSDNGMGRITLKKNMVSGVNTLTQSMMQATNTIYVIRYDFTLGEDITVPANCVLEFDGGSVKNGKIKNSTLTIVETEKPIFENIVFDNTKIISTISLTNFVTNDYGALLTSLDGVCSDIKVPSGEYLFVTSAELTSNSQKINIKGVGNATFKSVTSSLPYILKCNGTTNLVLDGITFTCDSKNTDGGLYLLNVQRASISRCNFDGLNVFGIKVTGAWNSDIIRCNFSEIGTRSLWYDTLESMTPAEQVAAVNAIFAAGIWFDDTNSGLSGWSSSGHNIIECQFITNVYGIYGNGSWNLFVQNAIFEYNEIPIYVMTSSNAILYNIWLEDNVLDRVIHGNDTVIVRGGRNVNVFGTTETSVSNILPITTVKQFIENGNTVKGEICNFPYKYHSRASRLNPGQEYVLLGFYAAYYENPTLEMKEIQKPVLDLSVEPRFNDGGVGYCFGNRLNINFRRNEGGYNLNTDIKQLSFKEDSIFYEGGGGSVGNASNPFSDIYLKSPNGTVYKLSVDNSGQIVVAQQ